MNRSHLFPVGSRDNEVLNLTTLEMVSSSDVASRHVDGTRAIEERLFRRPRSFNLTVVPTWECNLRCPFCFVSGKLLRPTAGPLRDAVSPRSVAMFLERHLDHYGIERASVHLIGGEPMLRPTLCQAVVDEIRASRIADAKIKLTSNLTIPIRDEELALVRSLDFLAVSLDGDREHYEAQRIPIDHGEPFVTAVRNLALLRREGLAGKIFVSCAAERDFYSSDRRMAKFVSMLSMLGVSPERVFVGAKAPSYYGKEYDGHEDVMRSAPPNYMPCCSFRLMSNLAISGSGVYAGYMDQGETARLGDVDDDMGALEERHVDYIKRVMPILSDPTCLSCPVVGACWGRCVNQAVTGGRPSSSCDQGGLIAKVEAACASGEILGVVGR